MALMGLKARCIIRETRHKVFYDGFKDKLYSSFLRNAYVKSQILL